MINYKELETKILSIIDIDSNINPSLTMNSNDISKWTTIRVGTTRVIGKPIQVFEFQLSPNQSEIIKKFRKGQKVIILQKKMV